MSGYIFEGDPRIFITENGAEMVFRAGQPIMDKGLENGAVITLFTEDGWPGNAFITDTTEHVGSKFQYEASQPITLNMLNRTANAAKKALAWMIDAKIASTIEAKTYNPYGQTVKTEIKIAPPGKAAFTLLVTKYGANWTAQKLDPAHGRI